MIIDAHHHFWRSHSILPVSFGPEDLAPELRTNGIDATILVQSADEPAENDRLVDYAKCEFVAGVVAWLPLAQPQRAFAELSRLSLGKLRGVRCVINRDPLEWLNRDEAVRMFRHIAERNLVWDVAPINQAQTEAILQLAQTVPNLRIAVGHLARPPLGNSDWRQWAHNIERLATCQNIALKVSVGLDLLTSYQGWPGDQILPFVEWTAKKFGAPRLMLASNWPVVLLHTDYQQAWGDARTAIEEIFPHEDERSWLLGGTAEHWYRTPGTTTVR